MPSVKDANAIIRAKLIEIEVPTTFAGASGCSVTTSIVVDKTVTINSIEDSVAEKMVTLAGRD